MAPRPNTTHSSPPAVLLWKLTSILMVIVRSDNHPQPHPLPSLCCVIPLPLAIRPPASLRVLYPTFLFLTAISDDLRLA